VDQQAVQLLAARVLVEGGAEANLRMAALHDGAGEPACALCTRVAWDVLRVVDDGEASGVQATARRARPGQANWALRHCGHGQGPPPSQEPHEHPQPSPLFPRLLLLLLLLLVKPSLLSSPRLPRIPRLLSPAACCPVTALPRLRRLHLPRAIAPTSTRQLSPSPSRSH